MSGLMYIIDLEGERDRGHLLSAVALAKQDLLSMKVESTFWHLLSIFKCTTSWWRMSSGKD